MSEELDTNQLEIPEELLKQAEEAPKNQFNVAEFCAHIQKSICDEGVDLAKVSHEEIKATVNTLNQLVQHMHMTVYQHVFAGDQLRDILNIQVRQEAPAPAPTETAH